MGGMVSRDGPGVSTSGSDAVVGTDPPAIADRENWAGWSHQRIHDMVQNTLKPAQIEDLGQAWSKLGEAVDHVFAELGRKLPETIRAGWQGTAADAGAAAAGPVAAWGAQLGAATAAHGTLAQQLGSAASQTRASVPPPKDFSWGSAIWSGVETLPQGGIGGLIDAKHQLDAQNDAHADAVRVMQQVYTGTYTSVDASTPAFPAPTDPTTGADQPPPSPPPTPRPWEPPGYQPPPPGRRPPEGGPPNPGGRAPGGGSGPVGPPTAAGPPPPEHAHPGSGGGPAPVAGTASAWSPRVDPAQAWRNAAAAASPGYGASGFGPHGSSATGSDPAFGPGSVAGVSGGGHSGGGGGGGGGGAGGSAGEKPGAGRSAGVGEGGEHTATARSATAGAARGDGPGGIPMGGAGGGRGRGADDEEHETKFVIEEDLGIWGDDIKTVPPVIGL